VLKAEEPSLSLLSSKSPLSIIDDFLAEFEFDLATITLCSRCKCHLLSSLLLKEGTGMSNV
jgi:hypothetical protein